MSSLVDYPAAPIRDPIAEVNPTNQKLMLPRVWIDWFAAVGVRVEKSAEVMQTVSLEAVDHQLETTPIPTKALNMGLYRVTYYLRVVAPVTTSSLQVTLGWTDLGTACFQPFPVIPNAAINTTQSHSIMAHIDQATPLTYQVIYSSTPAGLKFNIYFVVEQMQ